MTPRSGRTVLDLLSSTGRTVFSFLFAFGFILCAQEQTATVRSLIDQRALDKAEEITVRQLASNPRDINWQLLLAEIRLDQHRFDESLQLLADATQLGSKSYRIPLLAGLDYVALGRNDLAEPELRSAVGLNPSDATANYYLGRLLYAKNWFDEAIHYSQRAVELDPSLIRAYDNLGLCYEAKQMYSKAEGAYLQGVTRQRSSGAKIEWPALDLGTMLLKNDQLGQAEPYLQEAVAINPSSAEAHLRLGSLLEKQGKLSNSITELLRATELDPKLEGAHYRLGQVYSKLGETSEAEKQFVVVRQLSSKKN